MRALVERLPGADPVRAACGAPSHLTICGAGAGAQTLLSPPSVSQESHASIEPICGGLADLLMALCEGSA